MGDPNAPNRSDHRHSSGGLSARDRHDPLGRRRSEIRVDHVTVRTGVLECSAVPDPGRV